MSKSLLPTVPYQGLQLDTGDPKKVKRSHDILVPNLMCIINPFASLKMDQSTMTWISLLTKLACNSQKLE